MEVVPGRRIIGTGDRVAQFAHSNVFWSKTIGRP
jgi:hypothetical protein